MKVIKDERRRNRSVDTWSFIHQDEEPITGSLIYLIRQSVSLVLAHREMLDWLDKDG